MTFRSHFTHKGHSEHGSSTIPEGITVYFSLDKGFINVSNLRRSEVETALDAVLKGLLTDVVDHVSLKAVE